MNWFLKSAPVNHILKGKLDQLVYIGLLGLIVGQMVRELLMHLYLKGWWLVMIGKLVYISLGWAG